MNELLDRAIAAHGGMDRWRQLQALRVRFSTGGLLFAAKGQRRALHDVEGIVDLSRPRTSLFPYPAPGRRGVFEPERVWIESDRGELLDERQHPRAAFGRVRQRLWWDRLDVLYFAGYALWNYMSQPFLLARPGFVLDEIEPWTEGDERWRRLQVPFPLMCRPILHGRSSISMRAGCFAARTTPPTSSPLGPERRTTASTTRPSRAW